MRRTLRILWPVVIGIVVLSAIPTAGAQEVTDADSAAACDQAHGIFSDVPNPEASPTEELLCTMAAAMHIRSLINQEPTDNTSEWVLLVYGSALVIAIVVWLVVLISRVGPRRVLKLKAESKIAEVVGGQTATYAFTLTNKRKRSPAVVEVSVSRPPKDWSASLAVQKELPSGFRELVGEGDNLRVFLSARKNLANKAEIKLTVKPPRGADPEEWAELDVSAVPFHKENPRPKKAKEVRVVTLVREGETRAAIQNVMHTPEVFRAGDEVTTIVRLLNGGEVDSGNILVQLSVNGQKVDEREAELHAGEAEEVRFHWTAPEGKARVKVALG